MKEIYDVVVVGAGPVGLLCGYLGHLCGLKVVVVDKSPAPLQHGKADAFNARSLQLLELVGLFEDLYPLGKACNTSSIWQQGRFTSRRSDWWESLEGCRHKHFLMLGQAHLEQLLDRKLQELGIAVRRSTEVESLKVYEEHCKVSLVSGKTLEGRYVVGADGSRSLIRRLVGIDFSITRPELTWAVVDGIMKTDFPKVPEIIVFQAETSDVAWIPREGNLDRFYVRMDKKDFNLTEVMEKINTAMKPHHIEIEKLIWQSQFSVKESVAGSYCYENRVFLAGDACHIHSVNGGQGLNTGIGDAFNLMWKLSSVIKGEAEVGLLASYEAERRPVALGVVETSGELVRTTKYAADGSHAQEYVDTVEKRAGYITGMGICYGGNDLVGSRMFDITIDGSIGENISVDRLYSLLKYDRHSLVVFHEDTIHESIPEGAQVIRLPERVVGCWHPYVGKAVMVRPDGYIQKVC